MNRGGVVAIAGRVIGAGACRRRRPFPLSRDLTIPPRPFSSSVSSFSSYDWSKSTYDNYSLTGGINRGGGGGDDGGDDHDDDDDDDDDGGEFEEIRRMIDTEYHGRYAPARRRLQDDIVRRLLSVAEESDSRVGSSSADSRRGRRRAQWAVFTAGAMGAGKTRCLRVLAERGLFPPLPAVVPTPSGGGGGGGGGDSGGDASPPLSYAEPPPPSYSSSAPSSLDAFVHVDPDVIRYMLPEMAGYLQRDPAAAGTLTHQESCLVQEVLMLAALRAGRSIVVDGSLRNTTWYTGLFARIRSGRLACGEEGGGGEDGGMGGKRGCRIAIIHVVAEPSEVLRRAALRAEDTGRHIPREKLQKAIDAVPASVAALAPLADAWVTVNTDTLDPVIVPPPLEPTSHTKQQPILSSSAFAELWEQESD